ncbi:phosphoesterase [Legionella geestiana]|uniref:type IVB secretion system protein IcmM/DotJ n=1 Tax=Legionella geestiana TaxID=45065 RepID=UPI0010919AE4|nr:type IVB secretion system protein IcmM/DotJ [Legionella geestiana]QDQ39605.1 phosphoesterase [Legionella geestiana]
MSFYTWSRIKAAKSFYVRTYRLVGRLLLASMALSLILIYGIYHLWANTPERDFYATSGYYPPIQLTPLSAPNTTDTALLPPDPSGEDDTRAIPQ